MKKSRSGTPTTPNAQRKRPMGTITMSPEAWERLDAMRGETPRGVFLEAMLRKVRRGK